MRRIIAERDGLRAGDVARITVSLAPDQTAADVQIWTREGDVAADFAPHVIESGAKSADGRPALLTPLHTALRKTRISTTFEFRCDAPTAVRVMQSGSEIDAIASITRRGPWIQKAAGTFARVRSALTTWRPSHG
jgi:hypothetical protein